MEFVDVVEEWERMAWGRGRARWELEALVGRRAVCAGVRFEFEDLGR